MHGLRAQEHLHATPCSPPPDEYHLQGVHGTFPHPSIPFLLPETNPPANEAPTAGGDEDQSRRSYRTGARGVDRFAHYCGWLVRATSLVPGKHRSASPAGR